METKISKIAQRAKNRPKEIFTSIYHFMNKELLMECHRELNGNKATGIDQITKQMYNENLGMNIEKLERKLKNKSYKPTPAKRVYIPKANGKMRGLAIAIYEDKIVQLALKKIVEAIFEPKFPENMYGFRPNKGCHEAIKGLHDILNAKKIGYIVDADIKGFFDNVDHDWLMRCIEQHIKDPNILRLIRRFLKAGILDGKQYVETNEGTPQGSILSPVLANIYMYYVLAKWFEVKVKKKFYTECYIVMYADDFICCFQSQYIAQTFLNDLLPNRLKKFNLELAEDKTKLIKFGRYAGQEAGTFDFLGFTHYGAIGRNGKYLAKRKTSKKKYNAKIKEYTAWLKRNRILPIKDIIRQTNEKLRGHYHYYGVSENMRMLKRYKHEIENNLIKWLNRRSQKRSYTIEEYHEMIKRYPLEEPKIYVRLYEWE